MNTRPSSLLFCVLLAFSSATAFGFDPGGFKRRAVEREILALGAMVDGASFWSDVAARWARPGHKPETPDVFDDAASEASRDLAGFNALRHVTFEASQLVSATRYAFFTFKVASGDGEAERIYHEYGHDNFMKPCLDAARAVQQAGGSPEEVATAAARKSWELFLSVDDQLRKQVHAAVAIDLVQVFVDYDDVRALLEAPYTMDAWTKMLPEAQKYYRERVSAIVAALDDLSLT